MPRKEAITFLKGKTVDDASIIRHDTGDLLVLNFVEGNVSLVIGLDEASDRIRVTAISPNGETSDYLNRKLEKESEGNECTTYRQQAG